jgi:hypothetical protein
MRKESMDVARAQEMAAAVKQEIADLDKELQAEIDSREGTFDPAAEELEEVMLKPKSTDIALEVFGLTWLPYRKSADGRLTADWK